jgi:PAS domain S-box-containing protein
MNSPSHLLYLEDNVADVELLRDALQAEDLACDITRVDTEYGFREALEQEHFDLILADYTLPSFDGLSALRIARQQKPNLPFIFVSGTMGEEAAIEALKTGATDYVLKTRLSRLAPAVRRALREARERRELRSAERELREREAEIKRLVDASIVGIFIWNSEGKILEANDAFLRMVRYSREELLSGEMCWSDLTPPEWLDQNERLWIPKLKMTASLQPIEQEYIRKDGSRVPVLIGAASFDESVNRGVAFVLDLTERKRAEKELRAVLDFMPQLVVVFGPDRRRLYANRPTLDYFGMSHEEWQAVSDPAWFFHPDDRERLEKDVYVPVVSGTVQEFEARLRRHDGTYRWFLFRINPLRDEQGQIMRWYLSAMDIEDRRRAEEELRTTADELQRVMTSVPSCLFSAEIDEQKKWSYRYYSPVVEKVLGRPASFYIESPTRWLETIHEDDRARLMEAFVRVATGQSEYEEEEYRILRPNGEIRWIHDSSVVTRSGQRLRIYGVMSDVTDRKVAEEERERLRELEAELAHINRVSMLGEMAASLAHEIKQPIAAAINSANSCIAWLGHEPPNLEKARAAASKVDEYGNRAAEIIDRIRSFYRKSPPQRELIEVNGIVHEMLTLLRGEATRYSIVLRPELAAKLPTINADRVQLQQVFMNLMLNAIEAMKESSGELTVSSQVQGGQLLFSVSDTGVGLSTENLDRIFSAFYTTKEQGSGMGLAISRTIVESHGGRLWATRNDGPGATFHFTLPTHATDSALAS